MSVPFFGIWHEAWVSCLKVHDLDMTEREELRCTEAAKHSFYNPDKARLRPPFETFKKPWCRGSKALGNNCGHCEKCQWEEKNL